MLILPSSSEAVYMQMRWESMVAGDRICIASFAWFHLHIFHLHIGW